MKIKKEFEEALECIRELKKSETAQEEEGKTAFELKISVTVGEREALSKKTLKQLKKYKEDLLEELEDLEDEEPDEEDEDEYDEWEAECEELEDLIEEVDELIDELR